MGAVSALQKPVFWDADIELVNQPRYSTATKHQ
jgi:hypothetical protein